LENNDDAHNRRVFIHCLDFYILISLCQEPINAVMAKRRTREEKVAAKHDFTISWDPSTSVKSQKHNQSQSKGFSPGVAKSSVTMGTNFGLASIKKDLIKSISAASFIILAELVIYFFS
jgi:hypothetical protein